MMENGISELSDLEVDQVNGGGMAYVLGYMLGFASVGVGAFYGDLPAGAALL
jgi:hypothetical protein